MTSLRQWQNVWQALGVAATDTLTALHKEVVDKYKEKHRHYHTLQHLEECLAHLAGLRDIAENPSAIALALWFHDAIYEPLRHDNEQLSGDWARMSVLQAGLGISLADRIFHLVLATKHDSLPEEGDTKILVDIDLAILGAAPQRFFEYEQQIRAEYKVVPEAIFNTKRAELLQQLLARPTLFNTDAFISRYESQARANLAQAISSLI